jgi:hypothetical protein
MNSRLASFPGSCLISATIFLEIILKLHNPHLLLLFQMLHQLPGLLTSSRTAICPSLILPPCSETVLWLRQTRKRPDPTASKVKRITLPNSPRRRRVNSNRCPASEFVVNSCCLCQTRSLTLETAGVRLMGFPTEDYLISGTRTSLSMSYAPGKGTLQSYSDF